MTFIITKNVIKLVTCGQILVNSPTADTVIMQHAFLETCRQAGISILSVVQILSFCKKGNVLNFYKSFSGCVILYTLQ